MTPRSPVQIVFLSAILLVGIGALVVKTARHPGEIPLNVVEARAAWSGGVILALMVAALVLGRFRPRFASEGWFGAALGSPSPPVTARFGWPWAGAGLFAMAAVIAYLEFLQPYYFTQDDNLVQFLPVILFGGRSLGHGTFPAWDPYQFLGAPVASPGTYALTYPVTYLSYLIARGIGNERLTLEVFSALHLIAGYAATYWCARRAGLRPALAMAGALSYALSGYFLIVGRSWYYMTPAAVALPLLAVSIIGFREHGPTRRWTIGTGVLIGLFFHAGNAQMWAYGVLFWALALAWLALMGAVGWRALLRAVPALLLGLAIAAPLLWAQARYTADLQRVGGSGPSIGPRWQHLLVPAPLIPGYPASGVDEDADDNEMFYANTVFAIAGAALILAVAAAALAFTDSAAGRAVLGRNVWAAGAALAFLLALGSDTPLWPALAALPVFNKFNEPMKLLAILNLLLILSGGQLIERLLARGRTGSWASCSVTAVALVLLVAHLDQVTGALYHYQFHPYPPLPDQLAQGLHGPARTYSFAPLRSPAPDFATALPHELPTYYCVPTVGGYDPLVEKKPAMQKRLNACLDGDVRALRAFGVRWVLESRLNREPMYGGRTFLNFSERLSDQAQLGWQRLRPHLRPVQDFPGVTLYELSGSAPLAFPADRPEEPQSVRLEGVGVTVELADWPAARPLVINFLWSPEMAVWADGQRVESAADEWGRVVAQVPAGARRVRLEYQYPWRPGALIVGLLLGLAVIAWYWLPRRAAPA